MIKPLKAGLVLLLILGVTTAQAQFDNTATGDVNLSDPGWVKVGETFEVLNNGTGTDRFEHWGLYDAGGNLTDLILVILFTSGNGLSFPESGQFNYDLIAPNPQVTYTDGSTPQGRRVTLPATTAPLELSAILFSYGFTDENYFVFSNSNLGTGGDPSDVVSSWDGHISFHTDQEFDEPNSTRNPSSENVNWIPGTTTPATAVDVGTIDSSWDTDADGELSYAEWRAGLAALGYVDIHNIYPTTQTHGDWETTFDFNDVDIVTTPFADTDLLASGSFSVWVTHFDSSGKEVSENYGAWVTGTVDATMSVTDPRQNMQLSLYPNPTSDYFIVSLGSEEIADSAITIFDMAGQIVARQTTDVSTLSKGIYIVEIDTGEYTFRRKLILK
jgi:hypothetical protein